MTIPSPFCISETGTIIKKIDTSQIIEGYRNTYQIDVSRFFFNLPYIYLCECSITKLHYYYPFNLDGDNEFYKLLSLKDWYYFNERWEHKVATKFIKENDFVLEIGSGAGSFLKLLTKLKHVNYCGLELNTTAIELAAKDSIILNQELLSLHARQNELKYDVVCSFQVYEHVSMIHELFLDSIKVLKKNGKLIVSVPNNDVGFIKNNNSSSKFLNMPPHHVNLFTEESLLKIGNFYNLSLNEIILEPLQSMHVDVYLHNKFLNFFLGSTFVLSAFWKLKLHVPFRFLLKGYLNKVKGHSVIVVFEKQ